MIEAVTSKDRVVGSAQLAIAERLLCALSAIAIAIMMLVVVLTIVMRYFVGQPLTWSYDLIGSYLMVCAFFPAIADGLRVHSHIAIDVFRPKLPRFLIHLGMAVGYILSAALLAMIFWQGWGRLSSSWSGADVINMTVPWPTWPTYFLLCIGSLFMALRCLVRAVAHTGSLLTGRELASMPPSNAAPDGTGGETQ